MTTQNATTKPIKKDRRILRTRAQLLEALIKLLNQKDIKDISVTELTDLADINRGTFYLHYEDVYDMVRQTEEELFVEINSILGLDDNSAIPNPHTVFVDIFTFLYKNRAFVQILMGPHGDMSFVNQLKDLVRQRFIHLLDCDSEDEKAYYYTQFIVAGFVGIINSWLLSDSPSTPEVMATLCTETFNTVVPGIDSKH